MADKIYNVYGFSTSAKPVEEGRFWDEASWPNLWGVFQLFMGSRCISDLMGVFETEENAHKYVKENSTYSPFAGEHVLVINLAEGMERWENGE